ncbi:MAG TPA: mandelate racemase [Candidatus Dietzia intestinigallinarum]|nr:mandelate racemase [Candidatus Dietzia intestinigallinarum]
MTPHSTSRDHGGPAIDGLCVSTYTVPTDAPEADGTLSWDSTDVVLVEARAGGLTGTGWTYAPAPCAEVVRALLEPVVTGASALDVPGIAVAMHRAVRNAPRVGLVGYAIAAVDCALWDLKARILDVSLASLLGRVREDVAVYGSGGFVSYSPAQLDQQLTRWVADQQMSRVKIKIGHGPADAPDLAADRDWIRRARAVVGEDVELFVDANGAYQATQAVRLMKDVADARVTWFEEPVSSDHLDQMARVRNALDIDVAAGEYGTDLFYFQRMCASGAVDCLQLDISRCGGITQWQRIAAVAAAHGLEVSGHCAPHLSAAAAASTPNLRHLEWFHDHVRIEHMFFDGSSDPSGGRITPRAGSPGHGLLLRASDVAGYRTS